eukprot:TRINITY_DN5976_c3_g1_i1.p1 TRINITY_DN5976_c3_g1~~TRINITY_DN5976_c3_g1_i1.p1  ORF type:complete len:250 (+),score=35.80 TRINITY_DN5976_c3_g1_i1:76-825(+)
MEAKDKSKNSASKAQNLCCHYCRVSSKRRNTNKEIKVSYLPCASCRMSYCHLCLKKHLHIDPDQMATEWTCQRCNNACCCQFSVCTKEHQHCYTYRRTQQRHAQVAALKWTKKKKRATSPDTDGSDENSTASDTTTPKRKKTRTPVGTPQKEKVELPVSSNSEEDYIPVSFKSPPEPHPHPEPEPLSPSSVVTTNSAHSGESFPVLTGSLHFFPLETNTILPTDFLTEKNFLLDEDKEIKEEPEWGDWM